MVCAVDLGDDFSEEQEQEGEQHGHHEELQPYGTAEIDGLAETEVEENDDADVHHIVANEDGSKQPLAVVEQGTDLLVGLMLAFLYSTPVGGSQAEEGYLARRNETRTKQEQQNDAEGNPDPHGRHLKADLRH